MHAITRDVIIIDRTFCDLGLKESAYCIAGVSFESLDRFLEGGNVLLRRFFEDPEEADKTAVIMLTIRKGLTIKRRQLFLNPAYRHRWQQRLNDLYSSLGLKNPHSQDLSEIKVISEREFLRKVHQAYDIADIVLEKMREKPSIQEKT